jgi:hypothetical protein
MALPSAIVSRTVTSPMISPSIPHTTTLPALSAPRGVDSPGPGEFLTLGFSDAKTIVVDRAAAQAHDSVILERYHVPFDRSADLRAANAPR